MPGPTAAAGGDSKRPTAARRSRRPAGASRSGASPPARRPRAPPGSSRPRARAARAGLAGQVPVHARQVLAARLGVGALRRRAGPLAQVGAVHLPAHRHPLAATPAARPARRRFSVTRSGSSSVRMPRLSDSYGPSLTPPWRVEKIARAPAASSCRSPRQLQRGLELVLAARDEPVELAPQRLLERAAERGPSGTPAASRSAPAISSRTPRRSVTQRRIGSDGAPSASASASASGGSPPSRSRSSEGACSRSRAAPARSAARPARRAQTASRSRASRCRPATHRSSSARGPLDQRRQRRQAAVGADRHRPERRRGDQLGVGIERRVERAVDAELAHALDRRGRLVLGQQVHQLVRTRAPRPSTARPRRPPRARSRSVSSSMRKPSRVS